MPTKNQKLLLDYLRTKGTGEIVSGQDILAQTGWSASTLATYRSKHYIDPFLSYLGGGRYRVLQNGYNVTESAIVAAFTQVRPGVFTPANGMVLTGSEGSYVLNDFLGRGAVAEVWRCSGKVSRQAFAAKVMNPRTDLLNPKVIGNVRQRFSREARNGRRISHPNIVAYRDHGELEEHPFLIMDLAERSLGAVLKSCALSLDNSIEVVRCCLEGLQYLHALSCEHRDVKPDNMLQFGTRFVLGDLGIVSWSDMNPEFTSAATITRDSLQLGSWNYMAPEQRQSPRNVTAASDIYALGVSWYEMLTQTVLDPAAAGAKRFPAALGSSTVTEMIKDMVAYDPADRPSVAELLHKLGHLNGSDIAGSPSDAVIG